MDASIIGFAVVLAACLAVMVVYLLDRDTRTKRINELFWRRLSAVVIILVVGACGFTVIAGGPTILGIIKYFLFPPRHQQMLDFPLPTAKSGPADISLGPDGELWFAESDGNRIGRITVNTDSVTEYPLPTANSRPLGVTA